MFTTAYQRYTDNALTLATPLELVASAYQMTIGALEQAIRSNDADDPAGRSAGVNRALEIIVQLSVSLDHANGGVLSARLASLYDYMQMRIIEGHGEQSSEKLGEVVRLVETLAAAWTEISKAERHIGDYGVPGVPPSSAPVFVAERVFAPSAA